MSRKRKRKRTKAIATRPTSPSRKPILPAKFVKGNRVQVKSDTNFPDIPGGWTGEIIEVNPPLYLVEWDERTLATMHSVFGIHGKRDELELESTWLKDEELDPNIGEPPPIEQPNQCAIKD